MIYYNPGIYYFCTTNDFFCVILKVEVNEKSFEFWKIRGLADLDVSEVYFTAGDHQKDHYLNSTVKFNQYQTLYSTIDELLDDYGRNRFFSRLFESWKL